MTEQVIQQKGNPESASASLIQLQGSLVNKLIKRVFPDKIVTQDFKKQFSKALSIFILYVQNGQAKKKFTKDDIIAFLQRQGFGRVAQDLRKQRVCHQQPASRKKVGQQQKKQ